VDLVVVRVTNECKVVEVGWSVHFVPESDVVGLAPAGWSIASRYDTPTISDDQCLVLGVGRGPFCSAEVQGFAVAAVQDW
jgi:hypothetical protein